MSVPEGRSRTTLPRAAEAALGRFRELPAARQPVALIGLMLGMVVIGWADYVTGTRMSFVIFYLIPTALAVAWIGRWAGVLVALASGVIRFVADSTDDAALIHETWLWWNTGVSVGVYLLVVWMIDALIAGRRQLEQRVAERSEEVEREVRKRQEVQRELLELSASERSAMGRELHDQLGQHLVATALAAQVLAQRLHVHDEAGGREARQIADLVEQGIAQTRQLAHGLLLAQIEPARLGSEFVELCATLRQQYPDIACECRIDPALLLADASLAAQVFRIGQEALRNALRHAGAREVILTLEARGEGFALQVEDDGRGLLPEDRRGQGMGLRIMQHRAEHIGAQLIVGPRPGGGTRVFCQWPSLRSPLP